MLNSLKKRLKGGGGPEAGAVATGAATETTANAQTGRTSPVVATAMPAVQPTVSAAAAAAARPAGGTPQAMSPASHTGTRPEGHLQVEADLPRADVALPSMPKRERRRSSVVPGGAIMGDLGQSPAKTALSGLVRDPQTHVLLKDCPTAKKDALFKQKLTLCTFVEFDWDSTAKADVDAREAKRRALLDLMETINTPAGSKLLTEAVYGDAIAMVSANIFRAFPPSYKSAAASSGEEVTGVPGGEGEDEEPALDPAWPHLVLVYEFLLRFVMSAEVKVKSAKKFVDTGFCAKVMELFESEDPREREYLKTILHRIYGKFMTHRAFIRKAISHVFVRFVYETEKHPGIGELLEILGSIVNGFALPLKAEHVQFLEKSLLPLFRPKCLSMYIQQLAYCIAQYVEKDKGMSVLILTNLVRYWPVGVSAKQIVLLNAVEEILEMAGDGALPALPVVLRMLSRCVGSTHFQVAERALFMWQNEKLSKGGGILSPAHVQAVLPVLHPALARNATGHWNPNVEALAQFVLKHYGDADAALLSKCKESSLVLTLVSLSAPTTPGSAGDDKGEGASGSLASAASTGSSTAAGSEAGSISVTVGGTVMAVVEKSPLTTEQRAARWRVLEEQARKHHPELLAGT